MQNGDRVQFVSCPALPAVIDSATFYYLQNTDKLYLGSQLIANNVKDVQNSETPGKLLITQFDGSTREINIPGNAFGIDCYKGKFPLDFTSPGGVIDEWKIYGNSSGPAEVLEAQSTLPISIDTYGGNAVDWRIDGNNVPQVENKTEILPLLIPSNGDNVTDYTIYGNNNPCEPEQTSVLPITFETVENKLRDWRIDGNDDNGTDNEFDYTTAQILNCYVSANGTVTYAAYDRGVIVPVQPSTTYTLVMTRYAKEGATGDDAAAIATTTLPERGTQGRRLFYAVYGDVTRTFTTGTDEHFVYFKFCNTTKSYLDEQLQSIMLVKGSTAPDHYIPYQQGVGQRTVNKMPVPVNGVYSANRTTVTVTDGVYHIVQTEGSGSSFVYIDLPEFEVPDSGYINYLNSMAFATTAVVLRYNGESLSGGYALTPINRAVAIGSDYAGKKVNQIQIYTTGNVAMDFTIAPMITDSNTYTSYIPYGYQIPLTISQAGQPDKAVDIYIGDSPLTEGETVSKTSTGQDIELFEGENTISTTLYNKPVMYCGKALGVGMPTENLFTEDGSELVQVNAQGALRYGKNIGAVTAGTYYLNFATPVIHPLYLVLKTEDTYTNIGASSGITTPGSFTVDSDGELILRTAAQIATTWQAYLGTNPCEISITKGSTAPQTYIPFGYQVPIDVTDENSNTIKRTFYIGNSRLLSGDTYTKTQAGIDIPTTSGNNIISTELYNKPEMNVVCNSSMLGVGEKRIVKGNLPLNFVSDGTNLENYRIYGTAEGAGVQTENLWDGNYEHAILSGISSTETKFVTGLNGRTTVIPCEPNTTYSIKKYSESNRLIIASSINRPNDGDVCEILINILSGAMEATLTTHMDTHWMCIYVSSPDEQAEPNITVASDSTVPSSYIPHGYKLPFILKSRTESKDTDIYIGDSKLLSGDYVDYESGKIVRNGTPQDPPLPLPAIETFNGTNTLDSTIEVGETMITQGYRIPLQIKQGTTKTVDFYIGSAPLTEGQSISKTSTGMEIALYQGENTISTTLGNKPEMKIDYLSTVVGVGERTENLFDGTIVQGVWNSITGQVPTIASSSTRLATSTMLAVDATETYNIKVFSATSDVLVVAIKLLNSAKEQISDTGWAGVSTSISGADYIVVNIRKVSGSDITPADATGITITKGSTAPTTYIPYGYQLPIDIKQDDEVVDHKDIYIGTQPLVEGDYINQTGVYRRLQQFVNYVDSTVLPDFDFIPITEQLIAENGENTITTSLVNNTTIDVELHPTTHASWICDKLEDLQRRIDNVDSTVGAPERRNYLVTWCSEARLTHTGTSDAPLTTEFTNSFESADFASALTISGTSYATAEFMQTIDLLAMVTNYAHYYAGSSNYTVARPGDYVVIIYNTACSAIAANQSILLQIVQNDNAVITQALTDGYVGCVPFKILNLDFSRTVTQIRLIVESADAWTALNCQIGIAIVNASMVYQDSAALIDTNPRLSSMSLYDTVISANQQLHASLIDLTNRVEALEHGGGGSTYNETQTDTVTDAVEEVTQ